MELVYLLNNESFTSKREVYLSSEFSFEEKLFEFTIEKNNDFQRIDNFFESRISNVTAFIGKNGTGKTTNVCKPIMAANWLTYDFLIFKKDNKLLIFKHPTKENLKLNNKTNYESEEIIISDRTAEDGYSEINSKSNNEFKELVRLYYSNSYSDAPFATRSILDDISTSGLISKELSLIKGENEKTKGDGFTNFKLNELKHQIEFLDSEIGKEFSSNMNMNSKIIVSHLPQNTRFRENQFDGINLFSGISEINKNKTGDGFIEITSLPRAPRIAIILWSFVYNLPSKIQLDYLEFLRRKQVDFYENEIRLDDEDPNLNAFIEPLLSLLNSFIDHIDHHYIMKKGNHFFFSGTTFSIPVQIGKEFVDIHSKWLKEKISDYNFQWNISAGEYSYLSLFARIYGHRYRLMKQYFLLVIDEGDTNFHPEWSRKYINLLNDWIPKILSRAKGIQLVLTTHSPYVLSDLPSNNVFTLTKDKGDLRMQKPSKNTFGANINDLLANDFFLENGLIGEFAKTKIQTVVDNLQTDKDFIPERKIEKEEIMSTIQVIGEPFLKDKLLEMYKYKFKENDLIESEIEKLKSKLEKYENLKNRPDDTDYTE